MLGIRCCGQFGAAGSGFRWAKIKGSNDQAKACQDALQDLLHDKPAFQQTKKPGHNQRHGNGPSHGHGRGGGGGGGGGNPQNGYGVGNGGYTGSYGTGDAGWGQYGDMAAMGGMYGSYYDFPGMVGIGQQFWGGGMPYTFAGSQQQMTQQMTRQMMSTSREEYAAPEYADDTPKRRRSRRLSGHAAVAASSRPQTDHPDPSPSPARRRSRRLSTDMPPLGRPTRRTSSSNSNSSVRSPVEPKRPSPLKKSSAERCAPPALPSPPVAGGRVDGPGRNPRGPKMGDGRGGTARSNNNREPEVMRTKARAQSPSPSRTGDARPRDRGRPARRSSLRTKATKASPSSSPDRGPRPVSQGAERKGKQPQPPQQPQQPKQPKQPTNRQLNTKQRAHPPQPRLTKDRLGGAQQSDRSPPQQQPKPKRGSQGFQGAAVTGSSRQTKGTDLRGLLNRKRKPTVEVSPVNPTADQHRHQRQNVKKRAAGAGLLPTPASVLHLEPAAKKRRGSKGKVAIIDSRPKVHDSSMHLIDSRSRKAGGESQRRTAPTQAAPPARRRSSARNGKMSHKAAAPPPPPPQVSTPTVSARRTSSAGIPRGDRPRRSSERIRQAVRAEQEPDDAPAFSFGTFSFD